MQILGLGKVRIMRFSGRKGGFEGVLSGSDPDARDKEERQILFACKRRKRKKGTRRRKTEKRNKAGKLKKEQGGKKLPQICDRNEK
jgi:hypothetical protein